MSDGGKMEMNAKHLTDAELFGIALPAAGAPEALPAHLSECLACSRALTAWKAAVRDLAAEGEEIVERRTAEEWQAAQSKTMAVIRGSRFSRTVLPWRWAASVAAVLLLFAVAVPLERSLSRERVAAQASSELSGQDQVDDNLLRDVARLSRGDDRSSWGALAPEPDPGTRAEEDRL